MDRITGCPGSGRRARRAVSLLRERGVEVVVKTPLRTWNRDAIPAVAEWATAAGAAFRAFPVIVSRRAGDPAPLALRVRGEELREFLAGPHFDCGEAGALREADPSATLCAAGLRYCAITPSGDVVACNILPGSAGNVRGRSFREVWKGSPWLARIRALRRGDLAACRASPPVPGAPPRPWSRRTTSSPRCRRRASAPRWWARSSRRALVKNRPLASDNRRVRPAELRHPGRLVGAVLAAYRAGWRVQRAGHRLATVFPLLVPAGSEGHPPGRVILRGFRLPGPEESAVTTWRRWCCTSCGT
jgi:hypothetical protein